MGAGSKKPGQVKEIDLLKSNRLTIGVIIALIAVWGTCTGLACAEERLNYRLKWLPNMSTVGDLYAQKYGLFKAQGFVVDVKPGGPERDAIRELELGHADFGVASADQVIRALAKGSPVVVIAQLFQRNPAGRFRWDINAGHAPTRLCLQNDHWWTRSNPAPRCRTAPSHTRSGF